MHKRIDLIRGLLRWLSSKELTCKYRRCGFDPWVGKIPWRRAWQPTPVFSPGESHGQRSLAGYSPWGRTESDMTKRALTHTYTCTGKLSYLKEDSSDEEAIRVDGVGEGRKPSCLISLKITQW